MRCWRRRPPAVGLICLLGWSSVLAAQATDDEWFVDLSEDSNLRFVYHNGMSDELYFAEMMGGGAALIDYDGDGDLDVFLVQGSPLGPQAESATLVDPQHPVPLSDRLYRNDGWVDASGTQRLTFVDVTETAGLPLGDYGMGVASADVDNDGWPDLYVTNFGSNRLLLNRGDGSFEDVTASAGVDDPGWSVAASFLDYDSDGRLDLYVGQYLDYRLATHRPCLSEAGRLDYCTPSDYPGEADRLFSNRGEGRFEDVSKRSGVGLEAGASLGSIAADFNQDGLQDLFVARDGFANHMWLNRGDGTFEDGALLSGTAVNSEGRPEASMGIAVGDADGDGFDDLFLSHLYGESNTLYGGQGDGLFSDRSYESGLGIPSVPYTGFGLAFADLDNDMDLDIYVANGAVQLVEDQLLGGEAYPLRQPNRLYRNEGSGVFVDVSETAGPALALSEVSRGVASGDLEGDGDVDLVVVNSLAPTRLLANRLGSENAWIGLKARGATVSDALGARAEIELSDGSRLPRRIATDGSYASSSDPRAHWGLGSASATALELRWPDGSRSRFLSPGAGHYLVVEAPSGGRR